MQESASNTNHRRDVNVLLIGGTGHGKSFFINMFDKIALYESLDEAEQKPGNFASPIKFYHEGEYIVEGANKAGTYLQANSQTREPTIYEYSTNYGTLRLIDTPGTGDTQGSHVDEKHVAKIISCICQFEQIHAILLFFKRTDNRLDVRVKYQLCELLSYLGKAAVNNIQFIITHGGVRGELGQAANVIEGFIRELAVDIPFNESNTFCFENDPLKYLVLKQKGKSSYHEYAVASFRITYLQSAAQYVRLFVKAFNCAQPYSVKEYRALAVARQIWPQLYMAFAENSAVKEAIEYSLRKHDGNLNQILQRLAVYETNFGKTKNSLLSDAPLVALLLAGMVVGGGAMMIAHPVGAGGAALLSLAASLYVTAQHKNVAKQKQQSVEDQLKSERSRKEQEEKAIEVERAKYKLFTRERAEVKQLDLDFACCLHQNAVLAFTSAKVQIIEQELKTTRYTLSMEDSKRLEGMLQVAEKQKKVFQQVSDDHGLEIPIRPEELLTKVNAMRDFEYYGPPIKRALDECKFVNAAAFGTIARAEAARGYIFDVIHRECSRK